MWKAGGGGIGELIDEDGPLALLPDDELHKLSLYLQSLK